MSQDDIDEAVSTSTADNNVVAAVDRDTSSTTDAATEAESNEQGLGVSPSNDTNIRASDADQGANKATSHTAS